MKPARASDKPSVGFGHAAGESLPVTNEHGPEFGSKGGAGRRNTPSAEAEDARSWHRDDQRINSDELERKER